MPTTRRRLLAVLATAAAIGLPASAASAKAPEVKLRGTVKTQVMKVEQAPSAAAKPLKGAAPKKVAKRAGKALAKQNKGRAGGYSYGSPLYEEVAYSDGYVFTLYYPTYYLGYDVGYTAVVYIATAATGWQYLYYGTF